MTLYNNVENDEGIKSWYLNLQKYEKYGMKNVKKKRKQNLGGMKILEKILRLCLVSRIEYICVGPQTLPTLLKAITCRKCAYPNLTVHSPKRP